MLVAVVMMVSLIPMAQAATAVAKDGAEVALFPADTVYVTQGAYNSYSHSKQNAFDLVGSKNFYAPFTGKIKKVSANYNAVLLQSTSKVHWANGNYDYMTVLFAHDNDISDLKNGAIIKQGTVFYQPGKKAPASEAAKTGTHVHLAVFRGTVNSITSFSGNVYPNDALSITSKTILTQTGGYNWKVYSSKTVAPTKPVINLTKYPTSINQGSSYGLYGDITATGANITKVTGTVKNSNGKTVLSTTDTPKSTYMNINSANLNKKLTFNTLPAGTYTLNVAATNSVGTTTWSKTFTVNKKYSTLKINLTDYPKSIKKGSYYGLYGTVSSNYKITKVNGAIINSKGKAVMTTTDKPNSTSMNINKANLNWDMEFNKLPKGNYTLKVAAVDASGKTVNWSKTFKVT